MKSARRSGALLCALLVLSTFVVASPAQAICTTAQLVPAFHDVTVNQGLGSYLPLVQGKQTVVRFFLSQPLCADSTQMLQAKSATLTITGGGQTTQVPADNLATPSTMVLFNQGPAANGPGNPLFLVPGSALDPTGSGEFNATFSMQLTYRVVNATRTPAQVVTDNLSTTIASFANGQAIAAPVHAETLPLKVLSVPLGTNNRAISRLSPQFSPSAATDAAGGFATLARLYPVRDGAGDLKNLSKGVRYSLNSGALLDVSEAFSVGTAPNKRFCGSGVGFSLFVQPRLYAYLHEYNTNQTAGSSAVADRVMGLVDQAISADCAQGWAGVGSPESWVATSYDIRDGNTVVNDIENRIGTVMGMETAHNAGAVPCGINTACVSAGLDRDDDSDKTHSKNTNADGSAPMRAYNSITGEYLDGATNPPVNRTVLRSQGSGWEDSFSLFELLDRNLLFCSLGGPEVPDCGFYPQTGASAGSSQPTFGISGTTDGTIAGTAVVESFVADDRTIPEQPGSPVTIQQRDSSGNIITAATRSVPTRSFASIHDHDGNHSDHLGDDVYFFASVPANTNAVSYELVWSGGTVLYKRDLNRAPTFDVYLLSTPDNPIPTDGTVVNFDDGRPIGTEITNQYNEDGTLATTDVSFSSTGGTPRISGSCVGVDLEALQALVGARETPPCRLGSTSSDPFSLRNNQTIGAVDSGLVMTFDQPQSSVRMATGNGAKTEDGAVRTTATLTATLTDGSTSTSGPVGLDVSSSTALEIDTGTNNIESVALTYNTPAAEEIDDLVFARAGSTTPKVTTVIARVTDDEPHMKMSWFAECTDQSLPLEVASDPDFPPTQDRQGLYRALFTFEPSETLTCASDSGSSGAIISARVNDGVQTATESNSEDPFSQSNHAPTAVIADPDHGSAVLENQGFTLYGQGVDIDEGVLPASSMVWELFDETGEMVDTNGDAPGTGSNPIVGDDLFRVQPPEGGWPVAPGEVTNFTVRLTVTDSAGQTDTTENTIAVFKDEDNDLIPAIVEPCFNGSDNNPLDALGDSDGDGLFNYEDPDPCSATQNFKATIVEVNPETITIPQSAGGAFTVKVQMNGNVKTVDPRSVRLSKFGGISVSGSQFFARKVSVLSGNILEAKFDRSALVNFFVANPGFFNKDVPFAVAGNGRSTEPDGTPFTYSWEGADWVRVQGG